MSSPPDGYYDGCTCFFDQFGRVKHDDICNQHDEDWWYDRTALEKVYSDWLFSWRLVKRHRWNWPWQPVALVSAIGALLLFNTIGWWWWKRK